METGTNDKAFLRAGSKIQNSQAEERSNQRRATKCIGKQTGGCADWKIADFPMGDIAPSNGRFQDKTGRRYDLQIKIERRKRDVVLFQHSVFMYIKAIISKWKEVFLGFVLVKAEGFHFPMAVAMKPLVATVVIAIMRFLRERIHAKTDELKYGESFFHRPKGSIRACLCFGFREKKRQFFDETTCPGFMSGRRENGNIANPVNYREHDYFFNEVSSIRLWTLKPSF